MNTHHRAPRSGSTPLAGTRVALAALALAATFAPAAVARADGVTSPVARCAHLRLVDADPDARVFLARLGDELADELPELDAALMPAFRAERLFHLDDPDAACLTAWVVVEDARARVRIAGPGRSRFVFRDLAVAQPLSELDRERVGQIAKTALSVVGDSPDVLDRAQALAASGVPAAPTLGEPPPALAATAPPPALLPIITIGASYGGTINQNNLWHGPGIGLAVGGTSHPLDPELWLDARYVLPHTFDAPDLWLQTIAARAGVSARWRLLRLGLGVGLDREALDVEPSSPGVYVPGVHTTWKVAARVFARIGSPPWRGFSASATLLLDAVRSNDVTLNLPNEPYYLNSPSTLRPGFTVEISWRS